MDKLKDYVNTIVEMNKYVSLSFLKKQAEYVENLKDYQKEYLIFYIDDGYVMINDYVRNNFRLVDNPDGTPAFVSHSDFFCKYKNPTREQIEKCLYAFYVEMQNIILNAPKTDKEIVVYRGVENIDFFDNDAKTFLNNGGIFSTTFSKSDTKIFGDYVFKIIIPKGFPCLIINDKTVHNDNIMTMDEEERTNFLTSSESEIMLPNGVSFKIIRPFSETNNECVLKLYHVEQNILTTSPLFDEQNVQSIQYVPSLNILTNYNLLYQTVDNLDLSQAVRVDSITEPIIYFLNKFKIPKIELNINIDDNLDKITTLQHLKHLVLRKLTDIEFNLDTTNLINLEYLDLHHSGVMELIVNKSYKLKYLNVEYTKIQQLDISNLINLEYLNVQSTSITHLDISKLTKLKYLNACWTRIESYLCINSIDLEYLNVRHAYRKRIEINNLINLKYVDISDNDLKNVDVSNLKQLIIFRQ